MWVTFLWVLGAGLLSLYFGFYCAHSAQIKPCPQIEVKSVTVKSDVQAVEAKCPQKKKKEMESREREKDCPPFQYDGTQPHLYKHIFKGGGRSKASKEDSLSILQMDDFKSIHHPNSAASSEVVLTREEKLLLPSTSSASSSSSASIYSRCSQIYLTRTGIVRYNKPNKCVAVVQLPQGASSPYFISHRIGPSAGLLNAYSQDHMRRSLKNHMPEQQLVGGMIESLEASIAELRRVMGAPVVGNKGGEKEEVGGGQRKALVVLVANNGVMDFVLNFVCSCRAAKLPVNNVIVYVGSKDAIRLVEDMGLKAIYSPGLGGMPANAAGSYGDDSFGSMMWLKVTAVYVALAAGYDVLFQDTDIVWFRNPLPLLQKVTVDTTFMDDGARTIRFTPFFENSGFYFLRYNPRTLQLMERMLRSASELAKTHSHQSTLTRYLTEVQHQCNLHVQILDQHDFPSGDQYHNDKKFLSAIKAGEKHPYVFHMSFTTSREDKVRYFTDIGMWKIRSDLHECAQIPFMMDRVARNAVPDTPTHCCLA